MFRTRFNYEPEPGYVCETPSMTQQHFKDECDINNIIHRAVVTGFVDPQIVRQGFYDDVSEIPDYQTALAIVADANEKFASLPSEVRKRFDNNPASMLSFIQDSSNRDEAIQLGLISAPAVESNNTLIAKGEPKE